MSRVGKAPGIINSVKEPVPPPGEDTVSYERHTKALQAEFRKTNRNNALVSDLMGRSFALRRAEILEKNYSLSALLSRFPFLQEADQVITIYLASGASLPSHIAWSGFPYMYVSDDAFWPRDWSVRDCLHIMCKPNRPCLFLLLTMHSILSLVICMLLVCLLLMPCM